jgi:hypothetical protein
MVGAGADVVEGMTTGSGDGAGWAQAENTNAIIGIDQRLERRRRFNMMIFS